MFAISELGSYESAGTVRRLGQGRAPLFRREGGDGE